MFPFKADGDRETVLVLSMRWSNAGTMPDWVMMDRELQKVATTLVACDFHVYVHNIKAIV